MGELKHAKLSASGSERWLNCPGSIKLSENAPEPETSKWAAEGTKAHDVLEGLIKQVIKDPEASDNLYHPKEQLPDDMLDAVIGAVSFVEKVWDHRHQVLVSEEKISLEFVDPGMFGTADIQIIEPFGRLQIWDYKHGAGQVVEVCEKGYGGTKALNTQLVYYALGVAYKYGFDFKEIEIGVIQPRATYAQESRIAHPDVEYHNNNKSIRSIIISTKELKSYIGLFKKGVKRTKQQDPPLYVGRWCHWCPAKEICPKQEKMKIDRLADLFEDDLEDNLFNDLGF